MSIPADIVDEMVNWLNDFDDEPLPPRDVLPGSVQRARAEIIRAVNRHQNFSIDFEDEENDENENNAIDDNEENDENEDDEDGLTVNERYLLALIEALKVIRPYYYNHYLILTLKYGEDHEVMRTLHANTLKSIIRLLLVLEGKLQDTVEDFSDSEYAILMAFMTLRGFSLEWFKIQRPDKAGGYFPYYNTSELDLSKFGIYHNSSEVDYKDNCFITAAISSKLFTNDEIDFIRSLINTRYLPRDDLKLIADILNVGIQISFYNPKRHKIDKAVKYNQQATRQLRLLLRCGHYMLYRDEEVPINKYEVHNLNTLITRMIESKELQLIPDFSVAEKFMNFNYEFNDLNYSSYAIKPFKDNNKPIDFKLAFTAIYDESNDEIEYISKRQSKRLPASKIFDTFQDKTLIYLPNLKNLNDVFIDNSTYKVKISQYRNTIQQIKLYSYEQSKAKAIYLRSFQSLTSIDSHDKNIFEFDSLVRFVKKTLTEQLNININDYSTLPKMSLSAAFKHGCFNDVYAFSGIVKAFAKRCVRGGLVKTLYDHCFEVDDVKCFDINSSYGTSMSMIKGIPKGTPKPFYDALPEKYCYAFIQANISNIRSDKLDRYGFIHEGINFIDSILYDEIIKYVDCDIDIINGYYFDEGFNNKINSFAQKLYQLRSIDLMNKLGKNMLSSLYGKSLQNAEQYKIKQVPKHEINEFIATNGNYILEMNKSKKKDVYIVKLLKSINLNFNLPQFGVQVLSESRRRMNEIINYCNNHDIKIYSIKTDSFVIPSDKVNVFEQKYNLGKELGEFKIEYEAKRIKFTSASCYRAELIDGNIRMRGKVE